MRTELHVDHIVVDTRSERDSAERVPAALRLAFLKLGQKLAALPSERRALASTALARLELEFGSVEEILGERGADRLAERLFEELAGRRR